MYQWTSLDLFVGTIPTEQIPTTLIVVISIEVQVVGVQVSLKGFQEGQGLKVEGFHVVFSLVCS